MSKFDNILITGGAGYIGSHIVEKLVKNESNIFCKNYHVNIQLLFVSPSPDDCILEHVLMVSPKRQYRGIFDPTTPATIFPERISNHTNHFVRIISLSKIIR